MNEIEFSDIVIPIPCGHIAGRWYGNKAQRPLIAIHGWMDNCGTFARLAPLLQMCTSLLCIDLPGHGYSTHIPAGVIYTYMDFVRVILRLMNAYKWEKISLMGHSMGGAISFIFTSLYPDRVDMIIGFDTIAEISFPAEMTPELIRDRMSRSIIEIERKELQTPMNEPPSYTYEECERLLYEATEHSVLMENCKYLLERNLGKSLKFPNKYYFLRDRRIKYLFSLNPSEELSREMAKRFCRNNIPHLVLKGGASENMTALAMSTVLPICESENPNFEIHVVENGTHHLHLNNPEQTANIIIDFWKRKNWPSFIGEAATEAVDLNVDKSKL